MVACIKKPFQKQVLKRFYRLFDKDKRRLKA